MKFTKLDSTYTASSASLHYITTFQQKTYVCKKIFFYRFETVVILREFE